MHFWPHRHTEAEQIRPMLEYLLAQAIEALKKRDIDGGVKFLGCLSHYLGDGTQPAHLIKEDLMKRLVPPPEHLKYFHYHRDLEAITGQCAALRPARLLGTSVPEAMWRLADEIVTGFEHCQRYVVPSLQAIFSGNIEEAEAIAGKPMTIAAQQTLDVMHTALGMASGTFDPEQVNALSRVDVRDLAPIEQFIDMVYGGALRDGNRQDPPKGAVVPSRLRMNGTVRTIGGLGVLPHSGMNRQRDCFLTYALPAGVFNRFECRVGLHPEIAEGAVEFVVELNGEPVERTGRMTQQDESRPLSVPLGTATRLTLRVADANDGRTFWTNHAIWGEPTLLK
jgi:hypothetical protein